MFYCSHCYVNARDFCEPIAVCDLLLSSRSRARHILSLLTRYLIRTRDEIRFCNDRKTGFTGYFAVARSTERLSINKAHPTNQFLNSTPDKISSLKEKKIKQQLIIGRIPHMCAILQLVSALFEFKNPSPIDGSTH